jgi:hypothetical protein
LLSATLRGVERAVECEVLARRLGIEPAPIYSDCTVIGAPDDMPDGEYEIEFEGVRATAMKQRGVWLTFDPPGENLEKTTVFAN